MTESAAQKIVLPLGLRLVVTRGSKSQPERAAELDVHRNTYARWEREQGSIPHEALVQIALEGWNLNWLLTGQGPERLDALQVAESPAAYGSQVVSGPHLTIALEMAEEKLRRDDLWLPKADFAELVVLILGKLQQGWEYARIRTYVSDQLQRLSKGESDAGGGRGVGAEGGGSAGKGKAKVTGQGNW